MLKSVIFRSWKHHFWTSAATTAVLTLSYSVLFGLWLGGQNLTALMQRWGENIQLTVYIKDTATKEDIENISQKLKSQKAVETVLFVDKKMASETFRTSLATYGPGFLKAITDEGESPFPASFFVTFNEANRSTQQIELVSREVGALSGVEDVSYGEEWLSNYENLLKMARVVILVLAVTLLSGALFTVSNAIRASLSARKQEIEILELVGATESTIRTPFVVEGAFQGLLGACLSLGILYFAYLVIGISLQNHLATSTAASSLHFFKWYTALALLFGGTGVGAFGSYFCVARLNTGWAAVREEG